MRKATCKTVPRVLRELIEQKQLDLRELATGSGLHVDVFMGWIYGRLPLPKKHPAVLKVLAQVGVTWEELSRKEKERIAAKRKQAERPPVGTARKTKEPDPEEDELEVREPPNALKPDTCPQDCSWRYAAADGTYKCRLYRIIPQSRACIVYLSDHSVLQEG